jgi:hypothetical protein
MNKGFKLYNNNVRSLIFNSPDTQKTIDAILTKNVELNYTNIYCLLYYSPDKQKTIDTILTKNVELTDNIVHKLINYSSDEDAVRKKINDLQRLQEQQQLKEEIRRIKSYRRLCREQYREHAKYL